MVDFISLDFARIFDSSTDPIGNFLNSETTEFVQAALRKEGSLLEELKMWIEYSATWSPCLKRLVKELSV